MLFQGGELPFFPATLEGWVALIARVVSGAAIGALFVWRLLIGKINATSKECTKKLEASVKELKAEREIIRQELKRDLMDEIDDRKTAFSATTERQVDMAQKLHNLMGEVKLMGDRIHEDRLAQARELAAMRLEVAKGFADMRNDLQAGFREHRVNKGA